MNENLIFEGNTVYEIDTECVKAKQKKEKGNQCGEKTRCMMESVTAFENDLNQAYDHLETLARNNCSYLSEEVQSEVGKIHGFLSDIKLFSEKGSKEVMDVSKGNVERVSLPLSNQMRRLESKG